MLSSHISDVTLPSHCISVTFEDGEVRSYGVAAIRRMLLNPGKDSVSGVTSGTGSDIDDEATEDDDTATATAEDEAEVRQHKGGSCGRSSVRMTNGSKKRPAEKAELPRGKAEDAAAGQTAGTASQSPMSVPQTEGERRGRGRPRKVSLMPQEVRRLWIATCWFLLVLSFVLKSLDKIHLSLSARVYWHCGEGFHLNPLNPMHERN